VELDVDDPSSDESQVRIAVGIMAHERGHFAEIEDVVIGPCRLGRCERERLLAVGVAAAAVVARLARAHLMPGLRHRQHQAVAIEHLEGERRIG